MAPTIARSDRLAPRADTVQQIEWMMPKAERVAGHRGSFAFLLPAAGLLLLLAACSSPKPYDPLPAARRFEDVFRTVSSTSLRDPDDSIHFAFAGLVTADRLFVLDPERGELRAYRRANGTLIGTPGPVGDGFGELRHPIAVARLDSNQFVVYDDKRDVLSFRDSLGSTQTEATISHGSFGGLVALPERHSVVLSGAFVKPSTVAAGHDLHEIDYRGHQTAAYGRPREPGSEWERKFNAEFAAVIGGATLVSGTMNSGALRFHDLSTAVERWVEIAPGWRRLEWPSDGVLRRGATRQTVADRIRAWSHQNRLMNGVFPLSGGRLVVRYQAYTPVGARLFYYVLADTTGRTLAITHATHANILEARGDTLFWLSAGGRQSFGVALVDTMSLVTR